MQLVESLVVLIKIVLFLGLLLILFGSTYFGTQMNDYQTYVIISFILINIAILFSSFTRKSIFSILFSFLGISSVSSLYFQNLVVFPVFTILSLCYISLLIISIWRYYKN